MDHRIIMSINWNNAHKFRDTVNKENVKHPCKYPFITSKKARSTINIPTEEITGQVHRYCSPSSW